MNNRLFVLALAIVIVVAAAAPLAATVRGDEGTKVILISVDAMRPDYLRKYVSMGLLPNFAKLLSGGVQAEYMTVIFPSVTAASHASISTGAFPYKTGIYGNRIFSGFSGTRLYYKIGFDSWLLKAEPIWVTVDKAGKRAVVVSFPHSNPYAWNLNNSISMNIYDGRLDWPELYTNNATMCANTREFGYPACVELVPTNETGVYYVEIPFNSWPYKNVIMFYGILNVTSKTLELYWDKNMTQLAAVLKEGGGWSPVLEFSFTDKYGNPHRTVFRLYLLNASAENFRLYRTWAPDYYKNFISEEVKDAFWENVAKKVGVVPDLDKWGLDHQWFGMDFVLKTAELSAEYVTNATLFFMKNYEWDLLVSYISIVDGMGHLVVGYIEPYSPRYNPVYEYYYMYVYELVDKFIGKVMEEMDDNTVLIVVSDHGMMPIWKTFHVNSLLARYGLVVYDPETGRINYSASKAFYFGEGQIFINRELVKSDDEYAKLVKFIKTILAQVVDPETGEHVVSMVVTKDEAKAFGLYGDAVGDIIFSTVPGYYWSDGRDPIPLDENGMPILFTPTDKWFTGYHGVSPIIPELHAVFIAYGTGVKKGVVIPPIRSVDVAPTIAYILNIPPPKNADGVPILSIFEGVETYDALEPHMLELEYEMTYLRYEVHTMLPYIATDTDVQHLLKLIAGVYMALAAVVQNITSLSKATAENSEEIKSLLSKVSDLSKELEELTLEVNATVSKLKDRISCVENKHVELLTEISELENSVNSLSNVIKTLQTSVEDVDARINAMMTMLYAALGISAASIVVAVVSVIIALRKRT